MLKYFSRKSKGVNDGMIFESAHSGTGLRDILANKVEFNYRIVSNRSPSPIDPMRGIEK